MNFDFLLAVIRAVQSGSFDPRCMSGLQKVVFVPFLLEPMNAL